MPKADSSNHIYRGRNYGDLRVDSKTCRLISLPSKQSSNIPGVIGNLAFCKAGYDSVLLEGRPEIKIRNQSASGHDNACYLLSCDCRNTSGNM